ncbi:MAG: hypothetical protein ACPGYV_00665 [Phycisphaeraceae bacterium]
MRLLQMLEPTVRPGSGAPTGSAPAEGKPAFEKRSFDDLLSEAKKANHTTSAEPSKADANAAGQTPATQQSHPLASLGGLGQVENAALRNVLEQAHGSSIDSTMTQ